MLRAGTVKGYKALPPPIQATTWPTRDLSNPALVSERYPMSDRKPLMPKATAVWLVENTSLTFDQIAEFCGLHVLEVKGIADGDVAHGIKGMDPISNGQLTREEIARAEANEGHNLQLAPPKSACRKSKPRAAHAIPLFPAVTIGRTRSSGCFAAIQNCATARSCALSARPSPPSPPSVTVRTGIRRT